MKTIVVYTGTKAERMDKALVAAREYLGDRTYTFCMEHLIDVVQRLGKRKGVRGYQLFLSFAGVQGATARAMMLEALRQSK